MKIEKVSDTDYKIYFYIHNNLKDKLNDDVKSIIKKLQKKLKLCGFYKVIFCEKKYGLFLHLIKIEDSFYKNTLDLRIIRNDDLDIYFKSDDYFVVSDLSDIKYLDKYYYGLVDESFDGLLEKVEFGDFIFGDDIDELLNNGVVI